MAEEQPAPRTLAEKLQFLYETVGPKGQRRTDRDVAAAIAKQGGRISANYLWLLRTGQRENLGLAYAGMIAKFFGVPVSYFSNDDPQLAESVEAQLGLAAAMSDAGVRALALRAHGLSASALTAIQKMVEHARELERLPLRPGIDAPAGDTPGISDRRGGMAPGVRRQQAPAPAPRRWFGVGHSASPDPTAAGTEAATAALTGRSAALLLVFASTHYDLPPLLEAVRAAAATELAAGAELAIVGCTSMGEIATSGATDDSVVVAALGGPGFAVATRVSRGASARRHESGVEAAGCLATLDSGRAATVGATLAAAQAATVGAARDATAGAALDRPHRALLLLCDGLAASHHEIVRGAHSVAGDSVPLVGGCAADNLTFTRTYQFHGDATGIEIMSDAVVGVAIGSDAPIGVGVAHGWRRSGEPMFVTRSNEGHLYLLDHEPAVDAYLRQVGQDRSIAEVPEKFREVAFNRPLGLARRDGVDLRVINGVDPADRSLTCLADVPEEALVWLMESDPGSLIAAAGASGAQAVRQLDGAVPIGLLAFDCGARKTMLGYDGTQREVAELRAAAGGTPVGGFYTYGEIARTGGARGMHHLTFVTLALA